MSATLGPIHSWMYNKIALREELIREIVRTAEAQGYKAQIGGRSLRDFVREELPPIEEAIDLSNIHASLSGMIDDVESRYAALITGLLAADSTRIEVLLDTVRSFGAAHKTGAGQNAISAFQAMNDVLLDGMPCDHALQLTDRDENRIGMQLISDLHGSYWESAGGDRDNFYRLRGAFLDGFFEGSGWQIVSDGDGAFAIEAA